MYIEFINRCMLCWYDLSREDLLLVFGIYVGDFIIPWKSKKQQTMSKSWSKAENRALTTPTCEIQWLTYIFHNLHVDFS